HRLILRQRVRDIVIVGESGEDLAGRDVPDDGRVAAEDADSVVMQSAEVLVGPLIAPKLVKAGDMAAGGSEFWQGDGDSTVKPGIDQVAKGPHIPQKFLVGWIGVQDDHACPQGYGRIHVIFSQPALVD